MAVKKTTAEQPAENTVSAESAQSKPSVSIYVGPSILGYIFCLLELHLCSVFDTHIVETLGQFIEDFALRFLTQTGAAHRHDTVADAGCV